MLVLSRKIDESIHIGGDIKITILRVKGNTIRIGIDAPRDVRVIRSELTPHDSKLEGEEKPVTVTAIVDSPTVASRRLFVGTVASDASRAMLRPALHTTLTSDKAVPSNPKTLPIRTNERAMLQDQAAPLREFLNANRSLTAV